MVLASCASPKLNIRWCSNTINMNHTQLGEKNSSVTGVRTPDGSYSVTGKSVDTAIQTSGAEQHYGSDNSSTDSIKEVFSVEGFDPVLAKKMALVNEAIDSIGMTNFQWRLFFLNGFGYAVDSVSSFVLRWGVISVLPAFNSCWSFVSQSPILPSSRNMDCQASTCLEFRWPHRSVYLSGLACGAFQQTSSEGNWHSTPVSSHVLPLC